MPKRQRKQIEPPDDEVSPTAPPTTAKRDVVTRWGGHEQLLKRGFVAIPLTFLAHRAAMKPFSLTPAEALFIIDLMAHKWDARAPYPGYRKLASWMGVSASYTRKLARSLEKKGFVKRHARVGSTNAFDLDPLFTCLAAHLKAEEKKQEQKKKKKKRSKP